MSDIPDLIASLVYRAPRAVKQDKLLFPKDDLVLFHYDTGSFVHRGWFSPHPPPLDVDHL